jgi:non-canonical purine NTP pyrophosphatase (RdgB/HAM1 family)
MAKTITFVTSNNKKFEEVKRWLVQLDPSIQLEQADVDLPEYQSLDVYEVAAGKIKEAWQQLKKPVIIDDGGIYSHKYPLFPGTFSKYIVKAIGLEGIWRVIEDDPRASMKCVIVYADSAHKPEFFDGECPGILIDPKNAKKNPELPYTEIFIPDGHTKTFAQLRGTPEEIPVHHRYKALKAFVTWLQQQSRS